MKHFCTAVTSIYDKNNLREEWLILAHKGAVCHVREGTAAGSLGGWSRRIHSQEVEEVDAGAQYFFLFI